MIRTRLQGDTPFFPNMLNNGKVEICLKEDVDKAIEEKDVEVRRLRRSLWIARANRAIEKIAWFKLWNGSISTMNPEDGARQEYDKWKKNLGKFLKKVKEYR